MKYIGIFLIATAVALLSERKQREQGKETWESKHNINVPKWVVVLMIIAGVIVTFIGNL